MQRSLGFMQLMQAFASWTLALALIGGSLLAAVVALPGAILPGRGPARQSVLMVRESVKNRSGTRTSHQPAFPRTRRSPDTRATPVVSTAIDTGSTSLQPASNQTIYLTQQTSWVGAGGRFVLNLGIHTSQARSQLVLLIRVYNRLTSRSELSNSLRNGSSGTELYQLAPLSLSKLTPIASGVEVNLGVTTGQAPSTPLSASPSSDGTINLLCGSGTCSGVYPVRVDLMDTLRSQVLGSFTTYLIYDRMGKTSLPLRLSMVIPVDAPVKIAATGQPSIGDQALQNVSMLVGQLMQYAYLPFDLAIAPPLAEALHHSSDPRAHVVLTELHSLAAKGALHPIVDPSYAPLDVASIVDSGLANQLIAQLSRGSSVLESALRLRSPPASTIWASRSNLNARAVEALRTLGITQFVLPARSLSATSNRLSTTQPFRLALPATSADIGAVFDHELTSLFSQSTNRTLEAHQVLAELAQIYFEEPNFRSFRAVVIDPAATWSPSASFLHTFLAGLAGCAFLAPITLGTLFSTVPIGAGGSPALREFSTSTRTSSSTLSPAASSMLRKGATTLAAFESAIPRGSDTAMTVTDRLENLLLMSEGSSISTSARQRYLGYLKKSIDGQLRQIDLTPAQITLTSRNGRIPITITSNLPYAIAGRLSLKTDKLIVLRGPSQPVVISHHDTVVYFDVRSRSAGDFPVSVELTSPGGHLTLLKGRLTVRSTAFSSVAIALSAAAVALLLVWWVRSGWMGNRRRGRSRNTTMLAAPGGS
ncbi:MAG: DUF6049 family protein, partial [Actinomycetota bacterium]|nr:DUF6049 family protein [Actinomycetota bacterium]